MPSSLNPTSARTMIFWRTAQAVGIAATIILMAGFFLQPELALNVLWNVLIPLLPATFLITPALWRGLCPLATLNMLSNGLLGRRRLPSKFLPTVGMLGMVLLVVLVPARRFLFNEHGVALAVVIMAVVVAALVLGAVFDLKAGFCNAICPVLPVEKLYGQHPLLVMGNPRCTPCTLCIPKGCIDLSPTKSILQALGPAYRSHAWLKTPYGVFAAAFPGFVVGYFTTTDVSLAAAGSIYLHVAMWAGGSYLVTVLLVRMLKVRAVVVLPVLAAAAVGLYYWFAAPQVASTLGVVSAGTVVIRSAALVLVGVWLWRALRQVRRTPGRPPARHTGPATQDESHGVWCFKLPGFALPLRPGARAGDAPRASH